jgi:spore coat polysaccharide biosynthesis protein SpsF (cytidylyltransferase family)
MSPMPIILLQSRISSSRLPCKAMLELGRMTVVSLSARRLMNTGHRVMIATSDRPEDDLIEAEARECGCDLFRGMLDDVLGRFSRAVEGLPDETIAIRATADNVFPDGGFVDVLLREYTEGEYLYLYANGPESDLPDGLKVELFRLSDLREADSLATAEYDREHVTPYIIRKNGNAVSRRVKGTGFGNLRSTIDTLEDYIRLRKVFDRVDDPIAIGYARLCEILLEVS